MHSQTFGRSPQNIDLGIKNTCKTINTINTQNYISIGDSSSLPTTNRNIGNKESQFYKLNPSQMQNDTQSTMQAQQRQMNNIPEMFN